MHSARELGNVEHTITSLEGYMTKEAACSRTRVIVAEELDLIFTQPQLFEIERLINQSVDLTAIARMMEREVQEIIHAVVHMFFDERFRIEKEFRLQKTCDKPRKRRRGEISGF